MKNCPVKGTAFAGDCRPCAAERGISPALDTPTSPSLASPTSILTHYCVTEEGECLILCHLLGSRYSVTRSWASLSTLFPHMQLSTCLNAQCTQMLLSLSSLYLFLLLTGAIRGIRALTVPRVHLLKQRRSGWECCEAAQTACECWWLLGEYTEGWSLWKCLIWAIPN